MMSFIKGLLKFFIQVLGNKVINNLLNVISDYWFENKNQAYTIKIYSIKSLYIDSNSKYNFGFPFRLIFNLKKIN